jgi:hypothetical protein
VQESNRHQRTSRRQTVIIILLAVSLVATLVYYHLPGYPAGNAACSFSRIAPNSDSVAFDQVDRYRQLDTFMNGSLGVYYDTCDLQEYIDIFRRKVKMQIVYEKAHPGFDYAKYKWEVGFYWMMKKDTTDNKFKLDFYFVPTLVDTAQPREVLDYFVSRDDTIYDHQKTAVRASGGSGNADDEGQVWP